MGSYLGAKGHLHGRQAHVHILESVAPLLPIPTSSPPPSLHTNFTPADSDLYSDTEIQATNMKAALDTRAFATDVLYT